MVHRVDNCDAELVARLGRERLAALQRAARARQTAQLRADERSLPSHLRLFALDNEGSRLHCAALTFELPRRVARDAGGLGCWAAGPSRVVGQAHQFGLHREAHRLLPSEHSVYMPHAIVFASRQLLADHHLQLLDTLFHFVVLPGLLGLQAADLDDEAEIAKLRKVLARDPCAIYHKKKK